MCIGIKFWKGSKIIRALSEAEYLKRERKRNGEDLCPSGLGITRNSPLTINSDSDSDTNLARRKRPYYVPTPPDLTDSDSSLPPSKINCSHSKCMKMFLELKEDISCIKEKLNSDNKNVLNILKGVFTCLICKSIATETNRPIMLPCCRNATCCYTCIERWLENSSICPHCRETLELENCTPQPILRPMFELLRDNY